ncbi:MAG: asparaginase [Rhizobiaceae bacterium]
MANPVLVEVTRGDVIESRHRGAVAVFDADGAEFLSVGDIDRPVFPRSAVKAIQALPFVESGAADRYEFGERELALACASHSGEPAHVELAASMLARAGLGEPDLECGTHWSSNQTVTVALARSGKEPDQLHNNCSGKHAGFLCACVHNGIATRGYVDFGHRYQAILRETMDDVTSAVHAEANSGTDGCSIPTYAVPLRYLASGFAKMATGIGLRATRAAAARRLFAACMAEPFFVAGTGRACTRLMQAAPGRIFAKVGAEGVYCGAVPELGLGIALKSDDGGERAAESMMAQVLANLLARDPELSASLAEMAGPRLLNRKGLAVGEIRPTGALASVS